MKALQNLSMTTKELVAAFNALPRNPKAPSGLVPNEWHFDLRFIQIEPTPSHIVSFVQPQSQFTHMERLPLGLLHSESGMAYFPDTAKEAAPMIAKAILYAFVNNLGMKEMPITNPPAPYAPWKLTTEDMELAAAVGLELRRIGVSAEGLCNVGISKKSTIKVADETFKSLFNGIKMAAGFHGITAAAISTPESITFTGFRVPAPEPIYQPDDDEEDRLTALTLEYCNWKSRVSPSDGTEIDGKKLGEEMWKEMMIVKGQLKTKNERVIKEAADCGDPEAALEYGMRLAIGLGCTRDRKLMHDYLIQAAYSPSASKKVKAMAHGRLMNWYIDSAGKDPGSYIRARYLFGAAHHCNEAAKLCRDVSPRGAPASPVVLFFMKNMFQTFSSTVLELNLWYKDAIKALEDRNKQYEKGQNKMAQKRLKHPNRYRCAAPGCGVQSDVGSMLAKCAGSCDADKKPSYCSKECQKADWKNHKPFCRPGAECSVVDDGSFNLAETAPSGKTANGALQIPVEFADGKKMLLSSSTMDPKMLKELQEAASNKSFGEGSAPSFIQHIDFNAVD